MSTCVLFRTTAHTTESEAGVTRNATYWFALARATEANCSGMLGGGLQSTMAIAWLVGMVGSGIASTIAVCCMALLDLA